jgi:hypothetical protein
MDAQTLAKTLPEQKIEFLPFSSLSQLLQLSDPPLMRDGFPQLAYIERYLRKADPKCLSVVVERYYIDRDFIADFSAFYSTSLYSYPNWCQRIHFFSIEKREVRRRLRDLARLGADDEARGGVAYQRACEAFSEEAYMGFSVIKPLQGSPVGRTVLRHYKEDAGQGLLRKFNCTRHYKTNLLGIELTVCGLVFQQQDVGVSACATTAVWSSLSKTKDFEDISTPTPAQITKLASQYLLPFGRSMPSEGLSVGQMCQAIQANRVSPNLIRVDTLNNGRGYIHSAVLSGFAPILVLENVSNSGAFHAVTVAGMKIRAKHRPTIIEGWIDDEAGDVVSIYVHDDRSSPYFRADFPKSGKQPILSFRIENDAGDVGFIERWQLRHVLVPIHDKIRLSFSSLREITVEVFKIVQACSEAYASLISPIDVGKVRFRNAILRGPIYVQHLFYGKQRIRELARDAFNKTILLSRYVGVARLSGDSFGSVDVLFDTTSTLKNPHCLGVVARTNKEDFAWLLVEFLCERLKCPGIVDAD